MLNDLIVLDKRHERAASLVLERIREELNKKYIVTISGEVSSGKCEISQVLARLLKGMDLNAKILHLDDYYRVPPAERTAWRKKHGLEKVGPDEMDWSRVHRNIVDFKNGKKSSLPSVDLITSQVDEIITDFSAIDVLIINGLYAMKIEEANLAVFVEPTYRETITEQIAERKEVLDEFRMQVLEQEHAAVKLLKSKADFYIDYQASMEDFHF